MFNRPTPTARGRQRGWSLIEATVGTAVASVLASVAVPNMVQMKESAVVATSASELLTALQLARSEAVRIGQRVAVSPRHGTDWRSGWVVYVDADDDGAIGANEAILQTYAPRAGGLAISAHFGATSNGSALSFTPEGLMRRPGSQGLMLGRLTVQQSAQVKTVCVATMRIRTVNADRCA